MLYTYSGVLQQLKDDLSLLSNWTKTLYFGVYQRLLEVVAYVINKFIYLAEFYYRESGWLTAERIESLMNQAYFLQYQAHRKIGASGFIHLSSDSTFNTTYKNIKPTTILPKWIAITSDDGTQSVYITGTTDASRTYYNNYTGPLSLAVSEGIPKSFVYTASGIASETIVLYSDSIDNDNIEVWAVDANENLLYQINSILNLYLSPDMISYYCQIDNSPDFSSVIITFGDGINSLKLNSGDIIKVFYAETKGDLGNITSTGVLTKIPDTLYDIYGNEITLYVTNTDSIVSGKTIEDIESIRNNAPNLYQTGYRLGSPQDWESVLNNVSYIQIASAWPGTGSSGTSVTTNAQTVYITALNTSGNDLTADQLNDLTLNVIYPIKSMTESVTYQPVEKVYIGISGSVEIDDTVTQASASGLIVEALDTNYNSLNTTFKTSAYQSKIWSTINNVPGIIQTKLDIFNVQKSKTSLLGVVSDLTIKETNISLYPVYSGSIATDNIIIVPNSCKIWVSDGVSPLPILIATETNGTFVNANSKYGVSGTVNYSAGQNACSYSIGSGVANSVYLSYKTKDGLGYQTDSVRINKGWQITDVDDFMLLLDFNTF